MTLRQIPEEPVTGASIFGTVRERDPTGGWGVAHVLRERGVDVAFTLSGGHLFPIFDGCVREGVPLIDVRHEQTAVHAAEGWAKTTRRRAVALVTAGPGVTNAMTGLATARQNGSPLIVLGGRAPERSWGRGALQEVDHPEFVRPLTRYTATPREPAAAAPTVDAAITAAWQEPPGVSFVDLPLDVIGRRTPLPDIAPEPTRTRAVAEIPEGLSAVLGAAERPVVFAGTDLYWEHGEHELRATCERLGLPVLANGMGRGLMPADHPLLLSHARRQALGGADVVLVLGAPLDFRLGYGLPPLFGPDATIVHVSLRDEHHNCAEHLPGRVAVRASSRAVLAMLDETLNDPPDQLRRARGAWLGSLRDIEGQALTREATFLETARPIHPLHVYAAIDQVLDRHAVVVCDGGDFASYAGRAVRTYEPGRFLDPGALGTLGVGPGYALAAGLAHPGSQVLLLLGDGAFGYLPMEFETMARFGVPVVAVVGNNGGQNLERQPMEDLYGYSIAAVYEPQVAKYHQIVEAMGGYGELVEDPRDLTAALVRAFASGKPACVEVVLDRDARYPRNTDLT